MNDIHLHQYKGMPSFGGNNKDNRQEWKKHLHTFSGFMLAFVLPSPSIIPFIWLFYGIYEVKVFAVCWLPVAISLLTVFALTEKENEKDY